jgi:hypothetical protein
MRPRRLLLIFILIAFAAPASALRITVGLPVAYVFIRVGLQGGVQTVSFSLATGQVGNGVAVVGTPTVEVEVVGRDARRGNSDYIVTTNSASGLVNQTGALIPFSNFSWTTAAGEFAAGQFNNSAAQQFFRYTGPFMGFRDTLTFRYANTSVYRAGTYTGTVVFTISQL